MTISDTQYWWQFAVISAVFLGAASVFSYLFLDHGKSIVTYARIFVSLLSVSVISPPFFAWLWRAMYLGGTPPPISHEVELNQQVAIGLLVLMAIFVERTIAVSLRLAITALSRLCQRSAALRYVRRLTAVYHATPSGDVE